MQGCLRETIEVVPGVTSIDLEQLERSLTRHFTAVHRLREALGLPEEMCEEVAEGIVGVFRNAAVERIEGDEYNQDFSFPVVPWGRIRSSASQPKEVAQTYHARLASQGVDVSVVNEVCKGDTCVYSFDHPEPRCDRPSPYCFPLWRRMFAKIGDQSLGLSLGYQGTSKAAADHVAKALSQAKVLDLMEARKGLVQGEGKTAE